MISLTKDLIMDLDMFVDPFLIDDFTYKRVCRRCLIVDLALDIRVQLYPKQSLQSLKSLLKDYLEFKEQEIWNEEAQNRLGV